MALTGPTPLATLLLLLCAVQALDLGYGGLPGQRTGHTGVTGVTCLRPLN